MILTQAIFSRNPVSWGENFSLTVSFILASSEAVTAGRGGYIKLGLKPNDTQQPKATYPVADWQGVTLTSGRVYTLTFSDNALNKTDVDDATGLSYDEIFRQNADVASGRAFPLAVEIHIGENVTGRDYSARLDSAGTFLYKRIAPVISGVRFADKNPIDPYGKFDGYVLGGQSVPEITGIVQLDPLDPNLTAGHKIEILTVAEPGSTGADHELIADASAGLLEALHPVLPERIGHSEANINSECDCRYTVTDSAGNSTVRTESIRLYNYDTPRLVNLAGFPVAERYIERVGDDGDVSYPASDDGELVRVSYELGVSTIGFVIRNPWQMDVRYGVDGADTFTQINAARTGTDINSGKETQDRDLLGGIAFPAGSRWYITLTVTDELGNSAQLTGYIDKAGGYANIEKHGAAIGMRTTATVDHKKFEVARDYESIFYGGIRGVNILTSEEVDTGGKWLNGKTIYAKTLVHVGAAGNTAHSLNLPAGVEMAWLDMANTFHVNYNGSSYPPYAVVNNVSCFICILSTTGVVYKTNNTTGGDFYIRVFYTKTSINALDTDKLDAYTLA